MNDIKMKIILYPPVLSLPLCKAPSSQLQMLGQLWAMLKGERMLHGALETKVICK